MFKIPRAAAPQGSAFDGNSDLYVATDTSQEVLRYTPEPSVNSTTQPAVCVPGSERETDATFDCTLGGEVDP